MKCEWSRKMSTANTEVQVRVSREQHLTTKARRCAACAVWDERIYYLYFGACVMLSSLPRQSWESRGLDRTHPDRAQARPVARPVARPPGFHTPGEVYSTAMAAGMAAAVAEATKIGSLPGQPPTTRPDRLILAIEPARRRPRLARRTTAMSQSSE